MIDINYIRRLLQYRLLFYSDAGGVSNPIATLVLNREREATELAASAPSFRIFSSVSGSLRTSLYRSWMGFRWATIASAKTGLNSPQDISPTSSKMSSLERLVG